jgi:hypothetical protein
MRKRCYRHFVANLRDRGCLEDIDVDGRIILKWIFKKQVWTGLISLRTGTGGGLL